MTAHAKAFFTSDGTSAPYVVPFPYLDKSHVRVLVDGAATAFSWNGDSALVLDPTPGAGLEVEISRVTPRDARLVDFADGSILTEAQLDTALLQQMYLAQEVLDSIADTMTREVGGQYDAKGYRLGGLADPTAPQEAATKAYADGLYGGVALHAAAAAASASSAQASETAATAAEASAAAWADADEDAPVAAGAFSARHHALKAEAFATQAAAGFTSASTETSGVVELADVFEARAGLDATRAVTPAGLAAWRPIRHAQSASGSVSLDLDAADIFDLSTTGAITLSGLSSATPGQVFATRIAYGGAHTVSLQTSVFRVGAQSPTFSAAAGAIDLLVWMVSADGAAAELIGANSGVQA